MLVSEILATVRPAYLETWDKVFEYFKTTPHEWRRVEELMEEIRVHGLKEPGRIDFHESFPGDENFLPAEEEYYYLGNGTHRFAAFVELGLEDFPVVNEWEVSEDQEASALYYKQTELEIWIKEEFLAEDAEGLTLPDHCFMSSLSFRLTKDLWIEELFQSSRKVGPGRSYTLCFNEVPRELETIFVQKFLERISCCIKPAMIDYISVGTVTHFDEDFWSLTE